MHDTGMSRRSVFACRCCEGSAAAILPTLPRIRGRVGRGNPTISRRNFVAGGVAALGLGAATSAVTPAGTPAQAKPHRIDHPHHLSPPPCVDPLQTARLYTPP